MVLAISRSVPAEIDYPAVLLRLVLGGTRSAVEPRALDWSFVLWLARHNGLLLRAAARLEELGAHPPADFRLAVSLERRRVAAAMDLMAVVSRGCAAHGIAFVFPKAVLHLPDLGDDLDLLVEPRSPAVDRAILRGLDATAGKPTLSARASGSTVYHVPGYPPLDIQHGRLGAVGEHTAFAHELIRNRRRVLVGGVESYVASKDDQLVLQGVQRVYGRLGIQLCDVISTIELIRGAGLDWDYVIRTSRRVGVLAGLSCYLGYVEQIARASDGQDLLPAGVRRELVPAGWGPVVFRGGQYRYPTLRVNSRLYARQLGERLAARNWADAGRLCLVPVVGVARVAGRLKRRWIGRIVR